MTTFSCFQLLSLCNPLQLDICISEVMRESILNDILQVLVVGFVDGIIGERPERNIKDMASELFERFVEYYLLIVCNYFSTHKIRIVLFHLRSMDKMM